MDNELDPTPRPRARFGGLSRRAAVAATSGGLVVGGITGGFLVARAATSDATTTATSTPSPSGSSNAAATPAPGTPAQGAFKPNEDPTHEAGESAAREAQENAGQRPTVP
jgi:hypothetical protein